VRCYAANALIFALSAVHRVKTSFHPWSQIATGNHLDISERKNSEICSVIAFYPCSDISAPLCGELPHVQIFMNDYPNTLT
jgi:hypothetical protein